MPVPSAADGRRYEDRTRLSTLKGLGPHQKSKRPLSIGTLGMTIRAYHIALIQFLMGSLERPALSGNYRRSRQFLCWISMIELHHVRWVLHSAILTWHILTFENDSAYLFTMPAIVWRLAGIASLPFSLVRRSLCWVWAWHSIIIRHHFAGCSRFMLW